ncbi:MAG: 30S ribosomal protein S11 [Candidatus Paceibacteria bacterium]
MANTPDRKITKGQAYIQATFNNTIITITDKNGDTIAWASAGLCGFRGPKKSTPYAARQTVKQLAEAVKKVGLQEVEVFIKGVGGGREAAIRALNKNDINVTAVEEKTPIPHNGCRPPKERRV